MCRSSLFHFIIFFKFYFLSFFFIFFDFILFQFIEFISHVLSGNPITYVHACATEQRFVGIIIN